MSLLLPPALARGELVLDKYRVLGPLGAGGMGLVVEAEHVELGRLVALKTPLPALVARPGFADRFVREARIVAALGSPHVARVLDVDRLEDGTPVLVLERLFGRDLDEHVATSGPLSIELAARLVIEACDAVGEAHERGVVHRDLKPANLFLSIDPALGEIVKVLDFGVAKLLDGGARTTAGHAIGSPRYMAPEQVRRQDDVDARADVWALGVTLARLVGDRDPFDGDDALEIAARVLELPPDLSGVPSPALVEIIARCLEKRRDDRTPDVVELARALAPLAGEAGERALAQLLCRREARGRAPSVHSAHRAETTETFDAPLALPCREPSRPLPESAAPPSIAHRSTGSAAPARVAMVALGTAAAAALLVGLGRPSADAAPVASAAGPVSPVTSATIAAPSAAASADTSPPEPARAAAKVAPASSARRRAVVAPPAHALGEPHPSAATPLAEPSGAPPPPPSARPLRDPLRDRK